MRDTRRRWRCSGRRPGWWLIASIGALLLLVMLIHRLASASDTVVHEAKSAAVEGRTVLVYESSDHIRTLRFGQDDVRQSQIKLGCLLCVQIPYMRALISSLALLPGPDPPRRILVLGLGGGVVVRLARYFFQEAHIDFVEHDQTVLEIAKQWFELEMDGRMTAHIDKSELFILRSGLAPYDLIISDSCAGQCALTTMRSLTHIATRLMTKRAMFIQNQWGWQGGLMRNFQTVFNSSVIMDSLATNKILIGTSKAFADAELWIDKGRLLSAFHQLDFEPQTYLSTAIRLGGKASCTEQNSQCPLLNFQLYTGS